MKRYRMEVAATICFDVLAPNRRAAELKALEVAREWQEGIPIDIDDEIGLVAYVNDNHSPEVVDIEEFIEVE